MTPVEVQIIVAGPVGDLALSSLAEVLAGVHLDTRVRVGPGLTGLTGEILALLERSGADITSVINLPPTGTARPNNLA